MQRIVLLVICLAAGFAVCEEEAAVAGWSYDAQAKWPGVCHVGTRQSPISFNNASYSLLPNDATYKIEFAGECDFTSTVVAAFVPDRHALVVSDPGLNCLVTHPVSGHLFKVLQFHFHTPSEHVLEDGPGDAEVHIVTSDINDPTRMMVVGVVYRKIGALQSQPVVAELISSLFRAAAANTAKGDSKPPRGNVIDLLPASGKRLMLYQGSLTTPPCSEIVSWVVFGSAVKLPAAVVQQMKAVLKNLAGSNYVNNRDTQPIGPLHHLRLAPSSSIVSVSRLRAEMTSRRALILLTMVVVVGAIAILLWKRRDAHDGGSEGDEDEGEALATYENVPEGSEAAGLTAAGPATAHKRVNYGTVIAP